MDELFQDFQQAMMEAKVDFATRYKIYNAMKTLEIDDYDQFLGNDEAFDAMVEEKVPGWFDGEDPTADCND